MRVQIRYSHLGSKLCKEHLNRMRDHFSLENVQQAGWIQFGRNQYGKRSILVELEGPVSKNWLESTLKKYSIHCEPYPSWMLQPWTK